MGKYYVRVFTDDSNVKEWEDLTPDKIHHIEFKGKRFDEVRHGKWVNDNHILRCSICERPIPLNKVVLSGEVMWEDNSPVNYCPSCGSKMDDE